MKLRPPTSGLLLASILGWALPLLAQVPRIEHPVTDGAGVLSPSGESAIEAVLVEHRQRTGVQIAVLTVGTTAPIPIEEFSLKVAEGWGGGSRGKDDGVLFTLAVKDRKMRTEVGYGLEAYLPDAKALRIQEGVKGTLRQGDYDGAVLSVVKGIASATASVERGKPIPPPPIPWGARGPWSYLGVFYLGGAAALVTLRQKWTPTTRAWRIWDWTAGLGIPSALALLFLGGTGFWFFYPVHYGISFGLAYLLGTIWEDSRAAAILGTAWYYGLMPWFLVWRGQFKLVGRGPYSWTGEDLVPILVAHLFGCFFLTLLFPLPYLVYLWARKKRDGSYSTLGNFFFSDSSSDSSGGGGSYGSDSSSGSDSSWDGGGGSFGGGGATSSW